jgi:hypothetical protein
MVQSTPTLLAEEAVLAAALVGVRRRRAALDAGPRQKITREHCLECAHPQPSMSHRLQDIDVMALSARITAATA